MKHILLIICICIVPITVNAMEDDTSQQLGFFSPIWRGFDRLNGSDHGKALLYGSAGIVLGVLTGKHAQELFRNDRCAKRIASATAAIVTMSLLAINPDYNKNETIKGHSIAAVVALLSGFLARKTV